MAIIKCPECGHEISDKAPFCPCCGVPIAGHINSKGEYTPNVQQTIQPQEEQSQAEHHQTEQPRVEQPETEQSQTEQPRVEQPETEQPQTEQPRVEQPKAEQQRVVQQKVETPKFEQPASTEPEAPVARNSSRNNKIIIAVVVIVAALVVGICYYFYHSAQVDREEQAYELAMMSKDPQVLQNYIDQFTDAPEEHRDSILSRLEMIKQIDQDWTNAMVSGSKSAIQAYLDQHPNSPFKAIAIHKIDSIDWSFAQQANSVEAFETYLEQHPDGEHIDDANNFIKAQNSKTVQPEEKQMVSSIFNSFFQSLNNQDEVALTSVINPLLTKFLGKSGATRSDVVTFMHKIYKSDVSAMKWQSLGDYSISKKEIGDQAYEYSVSFSALQSVTDNDNNTTDTKYKITGVINNDGRISELNMIKILE